MMRILLTGATGFVGRNIVRQFATHDALIYRCVREPDLSDRLSICLGRDNWSRSALERAISIACPDLIVHCAGVIDSSNVEDLYASNVTLAANLFLAVESVAPNVRVIIIGSAAEYGIVPHDELPVSEDRRCEPFTPYGISKYTQTLISLAAINQNISSLVIRLFNPVGFGMPCTLSLSSFALRIAAASAGSQIAVGNLDVVRDFIHVNEVARIVHLLALRSSWPWPIVNVCSGVGVSIGEILQMMIRKSGKETKIYVDPALRRPNDVPVFVGCTRRLLSLDIQPAVPDIDALAVDLLVDAEQRVGSIR